MIGADLGFKWFDYIVTVSVLDLSKRGRLSSFINIAISAACAIIM